MKRSLLISLLLVAAAGGLTATTYWMSREREHSWTTASPEAAAQLQQGFEELAKFYTADARRHFERALELDPELAVAKLHLFFLLPADAPERDRLLSELQAAELDRLRPHERFLISYSLARRAKYGPEQDGEPTGADPEAILAAYREKHPKEFFGMRAHCDVFWDAQSWDQAEACYQGLLELHPNWVQAQNRLGYIAMARGRFSEAEERFRTYRYIAPDQANPYDSMAELLILLGRYDEAESLLQEAIEIKPDFCHAYVLQAQIGMFSGRLERTEQAIDAMASIDACDRMQDEGYGCSMSAAIRLLRGDPEGAWQQIDGECLERRDGFDLFAHRAAVLTGRVESSLAMEEVLRQRRAKADAAGRPVAAQHYGALLAHMEGVRALAGHEVLYAVERLSEADALSAYWGGDRASFKLWNRLNLLRALELAGEDTRAQALRRKIRAVNPRLLADLDGFVTGEPASKGVAADTAEAG